ncbi:MAG: hypothetical protein K6E54_10515 [Bacteroidaceae bacterium]|nr:hypothetical protein [Bacteroidaceae bacterium]
MKTKRQLAPWILLAVFVPMLVLSMLHIHHSDEKVEETCDECVHHHCDGHLNQQIGTFHVCLLCQFTTLPMLVADINTFSFFFHANKININTFIQVPYSILTEIVSLRAPPSI